MIDAESDGQPTAPADGDDNNGVPDDEDGVTFSTLVAGSTGTATVTASAAGLLDAWVDLNFDGDWDDAGERITPAAGLAVVAGANVVTIPAFASAGASYARFRLSTAGGLEPTGLASDGEVEDYQLIVDPALDFGDAPDPTFPTLLANNGARHAIVTDFHLGPAIDAESDGQPTALADGDDINGVPDDEDGVTGVGGVPLVTTPIVAAQPYTIEVTLTNVPASNAFLDAWIDFNRDGDWDDAGERITPIAGQPLVAGLNTLALTAPGVVEDGEGYARFRLSSQGGLGVDGPADDGEVEDYLVNLAGANASISGLKFNDLNGNGTQEAGESGLAGWTINLYQDTNGNGTLEATERTIPPFDSAITASDGTWNVIILSSEFEVPGGLNLIIVEVMQNGWEQTPVSGPATVNPAVVNPSPPPATLASISSSLVASGLSPLGARGYAIPNLVSGTTVIDVDFGNRLANLTKRRFLVSSLRSDSSTTASSDTQILPASVAAVQVSNAGNEGNSKTTTAPASPQGEAESAVRTVLIPIEMESTPIAESQSVSIAQTLSETVASSPVISSVESATTPSAVKISAEEMTDLAIEQVSQSAVVFDASGEPAESLIESLVASSATADASPSANQTAASSSFSAADSTTDRSANEKSRDEVFALLDHDQTSLRRRFLATSFRA